MGMAYMGPLLHGVSQNCNNVSARSGVSSEGSTGEISTPGFFPYCLWQNLFIYLFMVTFHLQLLQNIGYIPHVVQYNLEPVFHPTACASHSSTPLPTPTGNH